jgi:tryptophanyl-tRNA synthetase
VQPSGDPHLGNYLGAFERWSRDQQPGHLYCVVDLHAMTVPYEPVELRAKTLNMATWLLAIGIDPDVSTLFVQSHVREHAELAWILGCVATIGELGRMTQFKEKSQGEKSQGEKSQGQSVSTGLFTYPVLMAADILLYQAEEVPVGDDQRQHVELTRDIVQRFNHRYGEVFTMPQATIPPVGARVMDLQLVDKKMSKSLDSPQGIIDLGESESKTRKKIMRAVTDSGSEVRAAADKPGITNLLDLMSAVTGRDVEALEHEFSDAGYGDFKRAVADAVNERLSGVRERYAQLSGDPDRVHDILAAGAKRARVTAEETMATVRDRTGLLTT